MRWLVTFIVILAGCSAEYEVRIRASEDLLEGSVRAEVAIVANCLSQSAAGPVRGDPHLLYELSSPAPSLGRVPEGDHGLFARFMDDQCNVRAAGCQEVEIENRGDATLVVEMNVARGFACDVDEQCVGGRCVSGDPLDAATESDAVSRDARSGDSNVQDGGVDVGMDVFEDVGFEDTAEDAGVGDAGLSDARSNPCLMAVCDDFEGEDFDYETAVAGDSTVALTRAEAHSGEQSVLVHAAGNSVTAAFFTEPFDLSQTGDRWARAWYLLPMKFVGISPFAFESGDNAVSIFTTGEDYAGIDTYLFPDGETSAESRVVLPNGRWTCVEMHIDYDGPNTVELFIDGVAAAEMDIPLPNAFPTVRFGAAYRDEMDPEDYDIYVDDIGMGTERLGCD